MTLPSLKAEHVISTEAASYLHSETQDTSLAHSFQQTKIPQKLKYQHETSKHQQSQEQSCEHQHSGNHIHRNFTFPLFLLSVHCKTQSTQSLTLGNVCRLKYKTIPVLVWGVWGFYLFGFARLFFGGCGGFILVFHFVFVFGFFSLTHMMDRKVWLNLLQQKCPIQQMVMLTFSNTTFHYLSFRFSVFPLYGGIQNCTTQHLITVWKLQNNSIYYITDCYKRLKRMSFQFH